MAAGEAVVVNQVRSAQLDGVSEKLATIPGSNLWFFFALPYPPHAKLGDHFHGRFCRVPGHLAGRFCFARVGGFAVSYQAQSDGSISVPEPSSLSLAWCRTVGL
jgi:hypothetical protein